MAATVFWADELPENGQKYLLAGDEGRHAATGRRIRVGEQVVLSDGRGGFARGGVAEVGRAELQVHIEHTWTVTEPTPRVVLVQALPKSDRADLAIELATEAGIDEIIPWQAARCVARWNGEKAKAAKGVARWSSVARAAAKQARRAYIPVVRDVVSTAELVSLLSSMDANVVVLHEGSEVSFADVDFSVTKSVVIVVGPEGGISPDEVDALVAIGAQPALLGPTVLRTSTAAAVALGAIGVRTARWAQRPPR